VGEPKQTASSFRHVHSGNAAFHPKLLKQLKKRRG